MIAGINGAVAGIGLVLTLYCDIRYMAAGAKLTTAFARRGLIAEHGISWMLPRLIGPMNAMDLLLSARTVVAEEAGALGLVRVLPAEGFAEAVQAGRRDRQPVLAALHPHHQAAGLRGAVPVAGGGHGDRQPRAAAVPRHRGLPRGREELCGEAGAQFHGPVSRHPPTRHRTGPPGAQCPSGMHPRSRTGGGGPGRVQNMLHTPGGLPQRSTNTCGHNFPARESRYSKPSARHGSRIWDCGAAICTLDPERLRACQGRRHPGVKAVTYVGITLVVRRCATQRGRATTPTTAIRGRGDARPQSVSEF